MNTWFPMVIDLLTSKNTMQRIRREKLDAFYKCASTLLSNQVSLNGIKTVIYSVLMRLGCDITVSVILHL